MLKRFRKSKSWIDDYIVYFVSSSFCYSFWKIVNIPSFQCKLNDLIGVKDNVNSKNLVETNIKNNQGNNIPSHLKFDSSKLEAPVLDYCDRNDIGLQLDELLVIEHYSRR